MNKKCLFAGVLCVLMIFAIFMLATFGNKNTSSQEEVAAGDKMLSEEEKRALTAETQEYIEALEKDATDTEASKELSRIYAKYGLYFDAANTIKNAILYAPADTELYDELLWIYRQSGNTLEALSYIDTISDEKIRRECIDKAYDRNAPNSLRMGNTMGNFTTGGMIAVDGDVIYYCDAANGDALSCLRDGKTEVLVQSGASYLNIVDEYIYFVGRTDYRIYKMNKDGSGLSMVSDTAASNLIIIGNNMYFINWDDECKVYSMNIDGSNKQKITDISSDFLYAYGTHIYINDRDSMRDLYCVSLIDGSGQLISMNETYFVTGYDNNIYFRLQIMQQNDALYSQENGANLSVWRMTTDGSVYEKINNSRSGYINADKGEVFFTDFEEEALYKVQADGTGLTKLCDDDPINIAINGDCVYYFSDNNGKKLYRIRKDGTGRECLN